MVERIPMGRMGSAEEVAALICWLASEECSFSTGRDVRHLRRSGRVLMRRRPRPRPARRRARRSRGRSASSPQAARGSSALDPETLELPEPWELLLPVEPPEIWCAGVTYERSRDARVEESAAKDVYELVYDADRPELFLKDAAMRRTVGPGAADRDPRPTRRGTCPSRRSGSCSASAVRSSATRSATTSPRARSRARTRSTCPRRRSTRAHARSGRLSSSPDDRGIAVRDRARDHRPRRGDALPGRDLHRADEARLRRARGVARPRQPGPCGYRPPHRHGTRAARRLHARARPHRRDPGPRDRHARATLSWSPPTCSKGAPDDRDPHRRARRETTLAASGARAPRARPTRNETRGARAG